MEYVYAVLLLHKCNKEINEENIKKVLSAAGMSVDSAKIKALVTALKDVNIEEAIKEAVIAPVAASTEKKEEKKEEKKYEEEKKDSEAAASGLSSLFG